MSIETLTLNAGATEADMAAREFDQPPTTSPAVLATAAALYAAADALHMAALLGSAPAARATSKWINSPEPGNLVAIGAQYGHPPIDCVGTYVATWSYYEPDDLDAWTPLPKDCGHSQIWMIVTLDGRAINWGNCTLWRIPRDAAERRAMEGEHW